MKMNKRTAVLFSAVLAASAVIPAAVAVQAAEATIVSDYVIQKSGKLYALSATEYKEMKAAGVHQSGTLSGTVIAYVKAGDGSVYQLSLFNEAKASISNGTMAEALSILKTSGSAETNLSVGQVVISSTGQITLSDSSGGDPGEETDDFEVIGIE